MLPFQELDHLVQVGIPCPKLSGEEVPTPFGNGLAIRDHLELTNHSRSDGRFDAKTLLDEGHEPRDLDLIALSRRTVHDFDIHSVPHLVSKKSGGFSGIALRPEKVQRYVRRIADDPAIVRQSRDKEELTGPQLDDATVLESGGGCTRQHQPDVLDRAMGRTYGRADVFGPAPAWLISSTSNGEATDVHQLELPLGEAPSLVRRFEPLQNNVYAAHLRSQHLFVPIFVAQFQRRGRSLGLQYHVRVLRPGRAGKTQS